MHADFASVEDYRVEMSVSVVVNKLCVTLNEFFSPLSASVSLFVK